MATLLIIISVIVYLAIGLFFLGLIDKDGTLSEPLPVVLGWPILLMLGIVVIVGAFFVSLGNRVSDWVSKTREPLESIKVRIDESELERDAEREVEACLVESNKKSSIR